MQLPVLQPRSCVGCTVCCVAPEVESLGKRDWERCTNLNDEGCSVYAERPSDCRKYRCGWLQGQGGDEHRPDRFGLLFSFLDHEKIGPHMVIHEVRAGALETPWARQEVRRLAGHYPVFRVLEDSSRQLLCATPAAARIIESLAD